MTHFCLNLSSTIRSKVCKGQINPAAFPRAYTAQDYGHSQHPQTPHSTYKTKRIFYFLFFFKEFLNVENLTEGIK